MLAAWLAHVTQVDPDAFYLYQVPACQNTPPQPPTPALLLSTLVTYVPLARPVGLPNQHLSELCRAQPPTPSPPPPTRQAVSLRQWCQPQYICITKLF